MDSINLRAQAQFHSGAHSLKSLKQQLQEHSGIEARRLSRLSIIAALGAAELHKKADIRSDCAVYIAAPFSSPALFRKMADNVLAHHTAMPFDFIANLHNAPAFHAAQVLGTQGATLFIVADRRPSSWTKVLYLAQNALAAEQQIALGFCYEKQEEGEEDGSVWLLLEPQAEPCLSLDAAVRSASEPKCRHYWQSLQDWLAAP